MTNEFTFVAPGEVDLEELVTFFEGCDRPEVTDTFRPFPLDRATAERLAGHTGRDRYFVAIVDDAIVGLGMLRGWDEGYDVPSFGVFVDPRSHGRGAGRAIVDEATRLAIALGAPRIRLSVDEANPRAKRLYETSGYVADPDQSTDTVAVMYRELEER